MGSADAAAATPAATTNPTSPRANRGVRFEAGQKIGPPRSLEPLHTKR